MRNHLPQLKSALDQTILHRFLVVWFEWGKTKEAERAQYRVTVSAEEERGRGWGMASVSPISDHIDLFLSFLEYPEGFLSHVWTKNVRKNASKLQKKVH